MNTIKSPYLSEKSTIGMQNGLYVVNIADQATKTSVADELKRLYNVEAVSVRIVNLPAKQVRFRMNKGTRSIRRKAYVQLKKNQALPGFEIQKETKEKKEKGK